MLDGKFVKYEANFDSLLKWNQAKTKLGQRRQIHTLKPNGFYDRALHAE